MTAPPVWVASGPARERKAHIWTPGGHTICGLYAVLWPTVRNLRSYRRCTRCEKGTR